jgi:DNA-binding XRE family transcriptional regulator
VFHLRKALGLTQRQLAARSGIQQAEISRIEAGSSNPTLSTLDALSHALDAELSLAPRVRRVARDVGSSPPRRAKHAKFLCLICAERLLEGMPKPEVERHLAQYRALTDDLRRRGQLVACDRLLPADAARTVRVRGGKVSITDGPFAETKELVGGYLVVQVRDRAEAVRLAARIPGASIGCVEVRPIADDLPTLRALGLAAATSPPRPAGQVDPRGARTSRR